MGFTFLCIFLGVMFAGAVAVFVRESYVQYLADRFAPAYNQAARAQWARLRASHPEVRRPPAIPCSGFVVRSVLETAAGVTSRKLWARSWDKSVESTVLAHFYDDAAYSALELKSDRIQRANESKNLQLSLTFAGV